MQVKKFEAKSMKEALELVKAHLGPEAIILSAKESHRGFGLVGGGSVEVTAAVSEETLRKKKVAETKLREELRSRFHQIPAVKQKEFINRVHQRRELVTTTGERAVASPPRISPQERALTSSLRYADILDDDAPQVTRARTPASTSASSAAHGQMVRRSTVAVSPLPVPSSSVSTTATAAATVGSHQVHALESQVRELKALVEKFQQIPQIPMSMHPGAEQGIPFELSPMYQRLTGQGVQPGLVAGLLRKAQKEMGIEQIKKPALVDAWVIRQLLSSIDISKDSLRQRYQVFMGCTGQGKTTNLVKLASHLLLKEKRTIAIISLDTVKVGAADQLKIYAQILNVPFAIVRSPEEWRVAEQKLGHIQHVLVDCPGFGLNSSEEIEWMRRMLPPAEYGRTLHYVQSILARDEETFEIAGRYQALGFHDVIFTRLDESARQGLLLNFQDRFKVPLFAFSSGPRIPEDIEFATKERVVDFLFKLTRVSKRGE